MEDLTSRVSALEENMRRHRHFGYDQTTEIKSVKQFAFDVNYTQFSTAGLTQNVTIQNIPAFVEVLSAFMYVDIAFAGTATLTLSVGPSATPTTLLTAQDAKTAGFKNVIGTDLTTNRGVYSATANTAIVVRATSTVNNLSLLTAGHAKVYLTYYG